MAHSLAALASAVSTVGFGASTANAKTVIYVDDDDPVGGCSARREVKGQREKKGAPCAAFEPLP